MKIAVLGGGITGLTTAYYLAKKNHQVVLFEKDQFLGGLASGFKKENWSWYLDKTYHHFFANDYNILSLAKEIGLEGIFFKKPLTASLYTELNNYRIFPVDTPQDFLSFPFLNLPEKIRTGLVLFFLKISPHIFFLYEKQTAEVFLKKTMGDKVWNILWKELFKKKFGKYAENILASFIWARIKKRTKSLGYIKGGFQKLVECLEEKNLLSGVSVKTGVEVKKIEKIGDIYNVYYSNQQEKKLDKGFGAVVSTLPTPVLIEVGKELFPENYLKRIKKINYLHNITCILETKDLFFDKVYWLNICDNQLPFTVLVQHTNFIDKRHYDNNHILYIGNYVDNNDKLLKMTDKEIFNYFLPYLKKINSKFNVPRSTFYVFKTYFAQPVFNDVFIKNKPDYQSPLKNFYIANADMTYPYDRGTNYAVNLGKKISQLII